MPSAPTDDSIESSLARGRAMEAEQYHLWMEAVEFGDAAAQTLASRAWKEAQKARLDVEGLVVAHLQEVGQLVSLPEAQERIAQRLSPLRGARASLSRVLAVALFPDSPHIAQPRIEAELARILDPAVASAEAPLVTPDASPPPPT